MRKVTSLLIVLFLFAGGIWGQVPGPNLNEGFEDGIIPDNWTIINVDGGAQVWNAQTTNPHTGLYSARVRYETSSLNNDDWLITPPLYVTSATTDEISFWLRTYSATYADPWEVLVSTTNTNPASFTMIDSGPGMLGEYVQKTYSLDEYGDAVVYVAIRSIGAYDWYVYVDDFTGPPVMVPTCPKPTDLTAENPTINSIELGWTAGNTETMWDVLYGAAGFDPETEGTLITGIEANPYLLENLASSTVYEFYVRAVCGEDEVSLWAGPKLFNTLCTSVGLPLIENFTFVTTPALPLCWSKIIANTNNVSVNIETTTLYPVSPPYAVKLYNSSADTAELLLITPEISDPLAGNRVMFSARGGTNYSLLVGTISDPADPATFTMVGEVFPTGTHTPFQVSLADYTGTDTYIAFKHGNMGKTQTIYIDDIVIEELPDCIEPINLTVSGITNNTAVLGWTAQGSETTWDVVYGAPGFDPLTAGTTVTGITANPYTLTGLASASTYEFYVRADCGAETVSSWSGPLAFTTLCDAFELPFLENFDGAVAGTFPLCWSKAGLATTNWSISNTANALGTAPELRFGYSPSFTGEALMVSPVINTSGETSVAIEFKHYFDYYAVPFTFGMKTTSDGVNWNTIWEVIDPTANVGPETLLLSVDNGDVGSATFQFAFFVDGYTFNMDNWYMDDIHVFVPEFGTLEGTVTEATRGPVEGALITAEDYQAYTDASGYYIIENMMTGTYDVTCEAIGYFPVTMEGVEILTNQTTTQDFTLGYATISVAPGSLSQTLLPGATATQMLTISNTGGTEPLTWSAQIQMVDPPARSGFLNKIQENQKPNANVDDINPNPTHGNPIQTDAMYDLLGSFPVFDVGGTYSVATDGNFIYTGRWNLNQYDKYELDGTWIESFEIPGAGLTRDLTFDGQYFYGSPNSAIIYQMDFNTKTLVSTITATGSQIRGIAYDADNDGFWVTGASFAGPLRLISRTGAVLQTVTPAFGGISGLTYDNVSAGGPFIWAYTPTDGTGTHIINKVEIATGITAESFNLSGLGLPFLADGSGGGLCLTNQVVPGKWAFMGVAQNEIVWILELTDSQSWLSLDISSGVINPGESQDITVTFDSSDLIDSTYLANIKINHNGQELADGTVIVPVSMIVASASAPEPPTEPAPPIGATMVSLQPEFSWINGAGTAQVQLEIRKGTGGFASLVYKSPWFTGTSFNLADVPLTLLPKQGYSWYIKAKNAAGITTSPRWIFTTIGVGSVNGVVTDAYSTLPLEGATITIEPGGYTATTSNTGSYSIPDVLEGAHTVTAEMYGYVSESLDVVVVHNQPALASFALDLFLEPPFGLHAHVVDFTDVHLTWQSPGSGFAPEWLTYSGETITNSIGTDGAADFDVAARFTPDMLAGFPGGSLTKIQFVPGEPDITSTYTLKVWEGVSPPTLIYSQVLSGVTADVWNEVVLTTPVPFDNTKELWFGFNCNTTGGYPAGCDDGPEVEGLGNMMYWNGSWTTLTALNDELTFNWAVKGYVESAKGGALLEPLKATSIASANQGNLSLNPVASKPTVSLTPGNNSRALLGFNVYRNGDFLVNTELSTTEYDDLNLAGGTYAYTVKAVYDQGESEAVGPKTVAILPPPILLSADADYYGVDLVWEDGVNYPVNLATGDSYSLSNVMDNQALTEKEKEMHGPNSIVPKATSGRAVGDDCNDPIILDLTTLPVVDFNTTCGRGNTYSETCLGNYDSGEDIVYQFTLTEAKDLKLTLTTVTTWTGMLITQECPISLNCVTFVTGYDGNKVLNASLAAGTYYVMIDTWAAPDCIPEFTLTIEEFVPEPGEMCGTAVTATEGLNSAPLQPYWYEFTPTEDKAITISSCIEGQTIDTKLEVYDACGGNLVAANDDLYAECSYYNYASGVTFNATAGVSYKIFWLNPYSSAAFDFTIELSDPCVVLCPPEGIDEGEPCGEDLNGGCNAETPAYTPIASGDVICGTAYANGETRDTDWYELVLDAPKTITWQATAEFPVSIFIVDAKSGDCSDYEILSSITAAPCETALLTATVAPGTYWLLVMPSTFDGVQCDAYNNYVAELTTEDAFLTYYNVFRDGVDIADVYTGNTYRDGDVVNGEEYCYTVSKVESVAFETAQSNELCATVPLIPEIVVNPESFNKLLYIGTSETETLTVENTGAGNLEWTANILYAAKDSRVSIPAFTGNISHSKVSMGRAPYTNQKPSNGELFEVLRGSTGFGFDMYPGSDYINFNTDAPGTYTLTTATSQTVFAADFDGNNVFYAIDNDAATLNTVDLTTGTFTFVGNTLALTDLAFDYTTNTMYAVNYDATSSLYTLDLATGATTLVGDCGAGLIISLACDGLGNLYGFDISDDALYSINKLTGAKTLIGAVGFDGNYAQSMAWDPASNTIYMSAYNNTTGAGELRVVDKTTGATTLVGAFPGGGEVCGLGFMGELASPWLVLNPEAGTVGSMASVDVAVTFDASNLDIGIYNATISITSNDPLQPVVNVPVELEVYADFGMLSGYVTDATTRGPVGYVLITVDELRYTTTTDENGYYELDVLPGNYLVTASKTGYITQTAEVTVFFDETTTQDFLLEFAGPVLLYADGGVGEINLGWVGNPAVDADNAVRLSASNIESKVERSHGATVKLPVESGRAVGDDCSNPIVIGALPYTDVNTTCGHLNTYTETCLDTYDGGEDIVYQLVITEDMTVELDLATTATWTGMLITAECPIGLNCVAFVKSSTGPKNMMVDLVAGTYYIMLDTWPSPNCFDFTLTVSEYVPCILEMPAGAIAEGEPCIEDQGVDVTNGGCNMAVPAFTPINCGDVIWGSASTYLVGTGQNRDTDWYEFVITEPKAVTFTVTAEFPVVAGILEQVVPGVAGCDNTTGSISPYALANPCDAASVTATLIPGTYYFWVSPSVFEGYPCGVSNNYIAELTCEETFVPYFNVIRDGDIIAQTYLDTYADSDVMSDVEYCYTVSQVIEPGVVTPESNELCASVFCATGCDYTMILTDQYGDGWNGASLTVMQGTNEIGTYTLASGLTTTIAVFLCDATETTLIWNKGSWDGECGFEMLDPNGEVLVSFLAGGAPAVSGEFFTFTTECPVPLGQDIVLTEGWSAWSSYLTPAAANVSDVMAPVVDDMIVTQHFSELFYPAYGINTMGAFSNNHGYLTKMAAEATLTITGNMADPTIYLNNGWNMISVLSECSILAEGVFSNIDGLVIAWEPTGNGIYYPAYDLYTLTNLIPGKAYYVKVTEAGDYTFPGCDKSAGNVFSTPLRAANTTSWNNVTYTGVNHVVVFDTKATSNLRIGDMIGAFANGSVCAGLVEYTGANLGFTLFGNDMTTMAAEGFAEGDVMTYKVFRAETGEEFTMDVVYSLDAPNSSTFVTNGLSVITDLKLAPVSIGENTLKNLSIYPNPSSGIFNIAVSGLDTQINYVVMNAQGQEIYNGNLMESQQLDLSSEAKGIYFIKFIGESVLRVEKLVIR